MKLLEKFGIRNKKDAIGLLKQFIKFGIVGLSNTIISLAVYYILVFLGVYYIIAHIFGFLLSVLNAYYWNHKYVFKKTATGNLKTFIKTFTSYGVTFLLSTFLLYFMVSHLKISDSIAPLLNLTVTIPLNFLMNKYWSFR